MQIQIGTFCIETNGDFFYVKELRKDKPNSYNITCIVHQNIRGTRIGFDDDIFFEAHNVFLWDYVMSYTEV